ncbi:MAG: hypothetical protein E5V81_30335, partial [Mesorhizobium sp.]
CRALLAGRVPEEAVTFCAYLLPERAAVWWGHECLSHLAELLAVLYPSSLAIAATPRASAQTALKPAAKRRSSLNLIRRRPSATCACSQTIVSRFDIVRASENPLETGLKQE